MGAGAGVGVYAGVGFGKTIPVVGAGVSLLSDWSLLQAERENAEVKIILSATRMLIVCCLKFFIFYPSYVDITINITK